MQTFTCCTREGDKKPMEHKELPMERTKKIALVAHDNMKRDLLEWAGFNRDLFAQHELYATAATGKLLRQPLGRDVTTRQGGPLQGDGQNGAQIAKGDIDSLLQ